MKYALFADVHSNLEAYLAVERDIKSLKPDKICFLGDVVGYGPNPVECTKMIKDLADVLIKGNHDDMTSFNINPVLDGFSPEATAAIEWTRKILNEHKAQGGEDYRAFLKSLKEGYTDGRNILVHGSPNDPLNEYILRERSGSNCIKYDTALALVSKEKKRLFAAHAHDAWVYHAGLSGKLWLPSGNDSIKLPANEAAVIMIGSVGQPRDGNPDACWVLLDGDTVYFRRCKYDIEKTIKKIEETNVLYEHSGERLREGK